MHSYWDDRGHQARGDRKQARFRTGQCKPSARGVIPHERFVLHPQPAGRRRQDLRLLQPSQAGPALRYLPPALFDEDPAGEPAPARGRRRHRRPRPHRSGGSLAAQRRAGYRNCLHARARGPAGLHRRAVRGRPGRHARCGGQAGRQARADQSADPLRTGHRPLGAGRCVRQARRPGPQRQDRIPAQPGTLRLPALGPEGLRQLQGGAAQHRHRPPGEPGEPGPRGDDRGQGGQGGCLPRYRVRYRQPHHDDQRHRRTWLGRGRH